MKHYIYLFMVQCRLREIPAAFGGRIKVSLFIVAIFSSTWDQLNAQTTNTDVRLPDSLIQFYSGDWTGHGAFASGKAISANLHIYLALDRTWLVFEHTDQFPNRYKALSLFGLDKQTGMFVAYTIDNFGGHRTFQSEGCIHGTLILTTKEFSPESGYLFQRFIYEKRSARTFKMSYETSPDGIKWKPVDFLIFTKSSKSNRHQ